MLISILYLPMNINKVSKKQFLLALGGETISRQFRSFVRQYSNCDKFIINSLMPSILQIKFQKNLHIALKSLHFHIPNKTFYSPKLIYQKSSNFFKIK